MQRFIRYSAVGAIATASHYLTMIGCVEWAHWPAYIASGVGAVVGAQIAYAGNRWYTFTHAGAVTASWPRFQLTALIGALLGMAIVGAGVRLGVHYLVAQVVATLASLVLTFLINKRWTFAT